MSEKYFDGLKTELLFEEEDGGLVLQGAKGRPMQLLLPESDQGRLFVRIERKAMLGQERLEKVELPKGIKVVGDWAFAGCTRLKSVSLPRCELGKGVFKDCPALEAVYSGKDAGEDEAALLAEAARQDTSYLMDLEECGSREWFKKWDSWLLRFLLEEDQEGYSGQVPCGEEDYGTSDTSAYESGRRREKARRSLLRLMHAKELSEDMRQFLERYISEHTAGSDKGEEAWQLILERYGEEESWYTVFAQAGGLREDNLQQILVQIPESQTRMKAYFIRQAGEPGGGGDPLSDLLL